MKRQIGMRIGIAMSFMLILTASNQSNTSPAQSAAQPSEIANLAHRNSAFLRPLAESDGGYRDLHRNKTADELGHLQVYHTPTPCQSNANAETSELREWASPEAHQYADLWRLRRRALSRP